MKTITKTDKRRLEVEVDEQGNVHLRERVGVLPLGYQRRQWDYYTIVLSPEEFEKVSAAIRMVRVRTQTPR